MKKTLLFVAIIMNMATSFHAQTTRTGVVQNEDSCYLYAVDSLSSLDAVLNGCPLYFASIWCEPNAHGEVDLTAKYPAGAGTTVYGIAVTSQNPILGNMYLDLSIINANLTVSRLATASNSDPYMLANYEYEGSKLGQPYTEVVPSHEYYFDRPIHIQADSFYTGIRIATNQAPYDEYVYFPLLSMCSGQTFYNITNIVNGFINSFRILHFGNFFPIVKLPCPAPGPPVMQANVEGMTVMYLGDDGGLGHQVLICSDGGDTVLLSDTTSSSSFVFSTAVDERWYEARVRSVCTYTFSGSDTLAFSRWSEPLRFYYRPDTTAIAPPQAAAMTLTAHPNPAAGEVTVRVPEAGMGADLELLDAEGRLLSRSTLWATETTLDLTPLPSGVYLLRAGGATCRVVKR